MIHDLIIGDKLFQHRNIHKITWISADWKTKNQIHHIAISKIGEDFFWMWEIAVVSMSMAIIIFLSEKF